VQLSELSKNLNSNMKQLIKISLIFIFLLTISCSIFCENKLITVEENPDVPIISKVLHYVADEFLLKENIQFQILKFKSKTQLLQDISNNFMSTGDDKFIYRLRFHAIIPNDYTFLLKTSAFIFFESLDMLTDIEKLYEVVRNYNQPIKFFVFIPDLTFSQLNLSQIFQYYKKIPMFASAIFLHIYFITNEADTVTLSTVDWYSPNGCNSPYLHKLNVFNKKSQKWNERLKNYEKFLNYHNCELVMMLPVPFTDGSVYHVSGYSIPNKAHTNFETHGITPVIFEIAAKYHNFRAEYQPVLMEIGWMFNRKRPPPAKVLINGAKKNVDVYFETAPVNSVYTGLRISKVVTNLNVCIFVTPAEKYSPYEKFFLPFDSPTWIMLLVTFMITFISIFIINRMSNTVQNLIYGQNIETPIWNVISIFFGISQTKLPTKNFSRFILTIFIYFCLIFRTCFQSKFFEFMTSEPRQPPPKTIGDLINRNYTLYAMQETLNLSNKKQQGYMG